VASIEDSANAIATSQLAFPEDVLTALYESDVYSGSAENLSQVSLETDNVFGEDAAALQMASISGDAAGGYVASLVVRVDTTTEPTGGAAPGGDGGAPGGEGGGGGMPPGDGSGGGPGGAPGGEG
jgi:hypothetical protein